MNHAIIGLIYQNVVDLQGTAVQLSVCFLPQCYSHIKKFFLCVTIAWHVEGCRVVFTLIDNNKLANQIATLLPIVVKCTIPPLILSHNLFGDDDTL